MRAVLFDFDGVLVDSMGAHIAAWDLAKQEVMGEPLSQRKRRAIRGKATVMIAQLIAGAQTDLVQPLIEAKKLYIQRDEHGVKAYDGVAQSIASLQQRGVPIAVASNAPRDYVRATVNRLGFQIPVVLGCEDVAHPKPAPDLYLRAARDLGVPDDEFANVVVFEDSTHGLAAAVAAGMRPIGITTHHSKDALFKAGAVGCFPSIQRALEQLD